MIVLHLSMNKFLSACFVVVTALACKAQIVKLEANKNDNSLLWEISGNGLKKPSYLFGTFHLICKQDLPFGKNIDKAIAATRSVYMELDMDDPSALIGGLDMAMLQNGKKLSDLYTLEEFERLKKFLKDSVSYPFSMLQKMKPLSIEALLYTKMLDCSTPTGVEAELMAKAKKMKKEIFGFETASFQASVLDTIPVETQAKNLLHLADSMPQFKKYFDKSLMLYKTQQLDSLLDATNEYDFGGNSSMDALLYNRNKNWVQQLKTILKKQNIFIAVGAGHLPGKNGLIDLLRKEGYVVRALKN